MKKILIGIILVMGIASCVMPVSASVYTINPGTGNIIQAAVNSASSGDTIVLNPGTYSENGIIISGKSLTFRAADGHGPSDTIIDGKSVAPRIFTVTDGSSLTIENLALRNGRAGDAADCGDPFISLGNECGDGGYGGAIYTAGNVALKGSTITGSRAGNGGYGSDPFLGLGGNGGSGGHGGAIYAIGTVTLTSSTISGCSAGDAGDGGEDDPILGGEGMGGMGGSGGAIYATGTVTLASSTVTDIHAGNGGAGASQKPGFKSVGGSGGAIYGAGIVTLTSSTISVCSAGNGGNGGNDNWGYDGGNGGAISAGGAVTITEHSTISGCSAGSGGEGGPGSGATYMGSWGGDGGHGGAIISNGPVTITSSTIENSKAGTGGKGGNGGWLSGHPADGSPGGNGGAIYSTSTVTLTSAIISGCSAGNGGTGGEGHTVRDGGDGGTGGSGGAIYSKNTVTLGSSAVTGCSAGSGGAGGSGGFAADNGAIGSAGNGGAIYTSDSVDGDASTFTNCAAVFGGAIYASDSVDVSASTFSDNMAFFGGAIYTSGAVTMNSSTITGCEALYGGAIYAKSGTIHFCRLVNNDKNIFSWLDGTGVYSTGGTIDATNNWWGVNSNPSAHVNSGVSYNPWLVLGLTATPPPVTTQEYTVKAYLTYDSDGIWHDPALGHVPDDIPVSYAVISGYGTLFPASAGTAAGISQTTFTSTKPGTAMVSATVDNQTVSTLIERPVAAFTVDDRSVVRQKQAVQFIDQSTSTLPLTYAWDFGDGSTSTQQNPPPHIYQKEDTYTVTLTVSNSLGHDTITKENYLFATPPNPLKANFMGENKAGQSPLTVQFTDHSLVSVKIPSYPAIDSWLWEFGDGTTSTERNPEHIYPDAGRYSVTLTVSNSVVSDTKTKDFITVKKDITVTEKSSSPVSKKVYLKLE
jgi:predicted outer membrane repeat protein